MGAVVVHLHGRRGAGRRDAHLVGQRALRGQPALQWCGGETMQERVVGGVWRRQAGSGAPLRLWQGRADWKAGRHPSTATVPSRLSAQPALAVPAIWAVY